MTNVEPPASGTPEKEAPQVGVEEASEHPVHQIEGVGTVVEYPISEELSGSFLEYAMSVIVSRALPDVRDGLKPVQRRILYSMWEQGLRSDRQHQKSAKVVGAVMGTYHPHGDCLAGDTRVAGVDGTRPTLKELYQGGVSELYVWASDEKGRLVPARAHSFRIGQHAETIYRITLADGGVVRATANHPFRTIDGEWVKAEDLSEGDLLSAGVRSSRGAYPQVRNLAAEFATEHQLVGQHLASGEGGVLEHGPGWGQIHGRNLPAVEDAQDLENMVAAVVPALMNRVDRIEVEHLEHPEAMYDFTVDEWANLHILTSETDGVEGMLCVHNSAIYDAMVRMAQDWAMGLPLVDGHGNFGSPDDGPAASRYTEARMAPVADHLTADLDEDTVEFGPNYDDSTTQPLVLPAKFPNLLVNGSQGIAVGVATYIPPHNLREVAEAAKLVLNNPKTTLDDILKVMPGPDFPTGGILIGEDGVREAFRTGKGSVRVRGVANIEEGERRRVDLVITELPYGVGPERFITRVVDAVQAKKVEGVAGISDHTDRYTGLRVVISLKTGTNPKAVLAQLYKHTPLEERISFNHVALVGGVPQQLGVKRMLELWAAHAREVVRKRSEYRLRKAEERLHLVEGLLAALDAIDEVVATLKKSRSTQTARENLMRLLKVTEVQANHILEMPLRRLTSLEARKLRDEGKELRTAVAGLKKLIGSPKLITEMVTAELEAVVEAAGGERRTRVITTREEAKLDEEEPQTVEIADEACVVTLSATGLIGRDTGAVRKLNNHDVLISRVAATTRSEVLVIGDDGVGRRVVGYQIPEAEGRSRGQKVTEITDLPRGVKPIGLISVSELESGRIPVFVTAGGVVKRLNPADLSQMPEVSLISLDAGDRVVFVGAAKDEADVVFITKAGQVLRTPAAKIRPQGRGAGGMAGISLGDGDEVVAGGTVENPEAAVVVTITDKGRAKASAFGEFPPKGRATGGVRGMRFLKGETQLIAAAVVEGGWSFVDERGAPLGDTALSRRDASGEFIEGGAAGAGSLR